MKAIAVLYALLSVGVCLPTAAQRDMRDARLGSTTSSGVSDRALESGEAKSNPALYQLSRKTGDSIQSLKKQFESSKAAIPNLTLKQYSALKLASKEVGVPYDQLLQARQKTGSLEGAVAMVKPSMDSSTIKLTVGKVHHTVNSFAFSSPTHP